MTLTEKQKSERARDRMIEKAKEYSTGTYSAKFVAPIFQKMVRAEAAAKPAGHVHAILDGEFHHVYRRVGECVCVTCGKVGPWSSGLGGMHTGHFLGSRRASILFDEANVAPQCSRCNVYESGAPQQFRKWMLATRGPKTVERLEELKRTTVSFSRDQLVDLKIHFAKRLAAAEANISDYP